MIRFSLCMFIYGMVILNIGAPIECSTYEPLRDQLVGSKNSLQIAFRSLRAQHLVFPFDRHKNAISLWFEASPNGIQSPLSVFHQLDELTKTLDFWDQQSNRLPRPFLPNLSALVQCIGSQETPKEQTLWGKILQMKSQQTIDSVNSLLGLPDSKNTTTFYGLLNQLRYHIYNAPLLAMMEAPDGLQKRFSQIKTYTQIRATPLLEGEDALSLRSNRLLRQVGSMKSNRHFFPDSILNLYLNIKQHLSTCLLSSFDEVQDLFDSIFWSPTSALFHSLNQSIERLQDESTSIETLESWASGEETYSLQAPLLTLRQKLFNQTLLFVGSETDDLKQSTLLGYIQRLGSQIQTIDDVDSFQTSLDLLHTHVLEAAYYLDLFSQYPLSIQSKQAIIIFNQTLPYLLNNLAWEIEVNNTERTASLLSSFGTLNDVSSDQTLLGALNQARKSLLDFPLDQALGAFPPNTSFSQNQSESLFQTLFNLFQTILDFPDSTSFQRIREVIGPLDATLPGSLCFCLHLISQLIHQFQIGPDVALKLIQEFLSDPKDLDSWIDQIHRLTQTFKESTPPEETDLLQVFPPISNILNGDPSPSFSSALWSALSFLFPTFQNIVLGRNTTGGSNLLTEDQSDLITRIERLLSEPNETESTPLPHFSEEQKSLLNQSLQCLRFLKQQLDKKNTVSFLNQFDFFTQIGLPSSGIKGTLWYELEFLEVLVQAQESNLTPSCEAILTDLESLISLFQDHNHRIIQFVVSLQQMIQTMQRFLEENPKTPMTGEQSLLINQIFSQLQSPLIHLISTVSSVHASNLYDELSFDLQSIHDFLLVLFDILRIQPPLESIFPVTDEEIAAFPQRVRTFADQILQFSSTISSSMGQQTTQQGAKITPLSQAIQATRLLAKALQSMLSTPLTRSTSLQTENLTEPLEELLFSFEVLARALEFFYF